MKITTTNMRINELLSISGDSMSQMERKTGINRSSISRYAKGEYMPSQETLYKIAKAYSVSPAWLMGYDVEMLSIEERISRLNDNDRAYLLNVLENLEKGENHECKETPQRKLPNKRNEKRKDG